MPSFPSDPITPIIVQRPRQVLQGLPFEFRWEFTRRHPYYLLFWETARRHWDSPSDDPYERDLGKAVVLLLNFIGVTDRPVPPAAGPDEVEASDLLGVWGRGAIAPSSFRSLAGVMLHELPPDSLRAVGELLVESASAGHSDVLRKYDLFFDFKRRKDPWLDKIPAAPIVGVNLDAPLHTILESVEQWVKELKAKCEIPEQRRRDDKLSEYLRVWDLREGWCGDRYDGKKEKTLREIAVESKGSISTVRNRYSSAFRYIVGHDYAPELWCRLFAPLKISRVIDPDAQPRRSKKRPWRSRQRREVPEGVVTPRPTDRDDHGGSFIETEVITPDMQDSTDALIDIRTLLDRGYSDDKIAEELELGEEAEDLIACVKGRQEDGL